MHEKTKHENVEFIVEFMNIYASEQKREEVKGVKFLKTLFGSFLLDINNQTNHGRTKKRWRWRKKEEETI